MACARCTLAKEPPVAASLSFGTWVSLCPYPQEPSLLARIVAEPTGLPDRALSDLYAAILSRELQRPPACPPPPVRRLLEQAAELEDAQLTWLPGAPVSRAVVYTAGDEYPDQVRTGMALQRVLLTATKNDIRAACTNQGLFRFGAP
ncbi:hypothetical protein ACI2LF_12630 [Kribbella sp. NPDC020789]